jgi:hypothetical protein
MRIIFSNRLLDGKDTLSIANRLEKNCVNSYFHQLQGLISADILAQSAGIPVYLLFKFILNA